MELTQSLQLILVALLSAIATLFLRLLVLQLRTAVLWLSSRLAHIFLGFPSFERNYRHYLIETEGRLPLQGIRTQSYFALDLLEIFVPPRLIPLFPRGLTEVSSANFSEAISSYGNRIVILGDPGTGKTTLLKFLAVNAARGTRQLPIYIPLREIVGTIPYPDLESYLTQLPFANEVSQAFFQRRLRKGGCLILLDGLDEVPASNRTEIVDWIHRKTLLYPNNVFVASSRTVGYAVPLSGFAEFALAEFNEQEILAYVRKWTLGVQLRIQSDTAHARANAEGRALDLARIIASNSSIRQLASNPFLLTIILVIHYYYAALPTQRGVLLDEVTRVMLESWDRAKGIIQHRFSLSVTRKLLGILALAMQEQKVWNLRRSEVERLFSNSFPRLGLEADQVENFLSEVMARTGLLVERQPGNIGFSHMIFQEYLAAVELAQRDRGLEFLSRYLDDDLWQETIILYAGLLSDATSVIEAILHQPETVSSRNLILAGRCLANGARIEASLSKNIIESLKQLVESDPSAHDEALSLLNTVDGGGL